MKRLTHIVFWSVIAAAFIGPGTVTTAAAAGANFGFDLLWALVFSTLACLVLQEAAARLTVVSGLDLGQAIRHRFREGRGRAAPILAAVAVVVGCAAYEAGNILGGVSGLQLAAPGGRTPLTILCGAIAVLLLWSGGPRAVARVLAVAVAVMGAAFLATAVAIGPDLVALALGAIAPRVPEGSGVLVLGLVGTTVVPYNLFLGSGLAAGERLEEMRFGLSVAVILGGIISMGVLVVGTAVEGELTFPALAAVLGGELGAWAATFFALGLFAAGFSSAVTAPMAAAVTVRSVASPPEQSWSDRDPRYRLVWAGVVGVGVLFGVADVKPIPVIILAQALNGLLLPLVSIFLLVAVNDRRLMGSRLNGHAANGAMGVVVAVTVLLGLVQLSRAAVGALPVPPPSEGALLAVAAIASAALVWPVVGVVRRARMPK